MTTVILIRHGESEANRNCIFAGQIDPDLMERGHEQAKITAKYIAEHYAVDIIYASDLQRAYKTATCLGEFLGLDVIPKREFREIDGGQWEGLTYDELPLLYPDALSVWMNDIGLSRCSGGESVQELGERFMDALTETAKEHDGKTVVVATHATPIRAMQSLIKTGGMSEMKHIPWVSNASVTVLEYNCGVWTIKEEGIDEHLKDLRTALPNRV